MKSANSCTGHAQVNPPNKTRPMETIERVSSLVFRQTLRCLTSRFGALLRDGVAKGVEVPFIIARCLLDILGKHPHHRGLELDEGFDRVEPDGGAGSHTALLFSGYTTGV